MSRRRPPLHREVRNRLPLAPVENLKILFLQIFNRLPVAVPHQYWHQHHIDAAFELYRVALLRRWRGILPSSQQSTRPKRK